MSPSSENAYMNLWAPNFYTAQPTTLKRVGKLKKVTQTLEDLLRSCALNFPDKWDDCLPLAEFSYNNSYQESIKMAPFEALYGRQCQTPLHWSEPGERFFRVELVKETENKVRQIQNNLKVAQSRQKSYADKRRRPLRFAKDDHGIRTNYKNIP